MAHNERGAMCYHDGLQICFALDGNEVWQIQLIAEAADWRTGLIRRWSPSGEPCQSENRLYDIEP